MKTKLLCGFIASMLLCGPARASELMTYFASTPLDLTGEPAIIQLQGFDPADGTLTGVKLSYSGRVVQTWWVENTGSIVPLNYTLSGSADLTLAKSSGGPALFTSPLGTFSFSQSGSITAAYDGALDMAGASGRTFMRDTTWTPTASYIDLDLASYLSNGMVSFSALATSAEGTGITGANVFAAAFTDSSSTLQVEYAYTLIPEPSTYAAGLGLVVFAVAALRRRRAASAA